MTKQDKIDQIVSAWLDEEILDTIYQYAGEKYQEWLVTQDEDAINEMHTEMCGPATDFQFYQGKLPKRVIET
jgi:hypothetical protein